jgi:hypothetical protein
MDSLLKADLFFFITAIAVVAVAVLFVVALLYLIKILRTLLKISERMKEEVDSLAVEFERWRAKLRNEGLQWGSIAKFFKGKKKK